MKKSDRSSETDPPAAARRTVRQQIVTLMHTEPISVRDISDRLGIPEKEIADHLAHIVRSLANHRQKLVSSPFQCLGCGYVFKDRKRFTRPGRCPRCKASRFEQGRVSIV